MATRTPQNAPRPPEHAGNVAAGEDVTTQGLPISAVAAHLLVHKKETILEGCARASFGIPVNDGGGGGGGSFCSIHHGNVDSRHRDSPPAKKDASLERPCPNTKQLGWRPSLLGRKPLLLGSFCY